MTDKKKQNSPASVIGIVFEMPVAVQDGTVYVHMSFGRVLDRLARYYKKVYLCCPTTERSPGDVVQDYALTSDNIEIIPQPYYQSQIGALKHVVGIVAAYTKVLKRSRHIFVRGMLPYVGLFYFLARIFSRRPCHWVVGNPVALLKTHRRAGSLKDTLSLAYARQDRFFTRLGRWLTKGAFLCNGDELARIYASSRTHMVVSSSVIAEEFHIREDTCTNAEIRLLFIGFIRPEKGLEYLIEAMSRLKTSRPCRLTIVGSWDGYDGYKAHLDEVIASSGLHDRIDWEGYVAYGPKMWEYLRSHDIFILPTLSEGTPRVLVEARANSLPLVATRVGGIPSSVTDGVDGLLVPPKDSASIADAIDKIIEDGRLRREMIRTGITTARAFTVDSFVEKIVDTINKN